MAPSQSEQLPTTAPKQWWPRRVVRGLFVTLSFLIILGMTGWMALAICYADLHATPPRTIRAALIVIVSLLVIVLVRPRRRGLLIFAVMFAGVLGWYFSIQPSAGRDWAPDVAVLPYATIDGNMVHLRNIRNFDYRTETDFKPDYYDRKLDLNRLQTLDIILSYWSGRAIAHAMVSFGFDHGQHVAVSIETRKEKSEEYSAIEGFFRQYELIYVVADERDLIRLRTNYRNEDVFLYRTRATREKVRAVFLDYIGEVNLLHDQPRFYNALTENCMTSVFAHFLAAPPYPPFTMGVLLSGYSARYGYEKGGLDHSVPFDELERRSHINDLAKPADQAADFSRRIRARLTTPQSPTEAASQRSTTGKAG